MNNENKVHSILNELDIVYEVFEHEPIYTAEQLKIIKDRVKGNHCKNLFLRNSKGDKYYLVVVRDDKGVDLKDLRDQIGSSRLSFASPERLHNTLGITPGSVNPFSIINDKNKEVQLYIDKEVLDGQNLNFHPNINTKMVNIQLQGFKKFIDHMNYKLIPIEIL